MCCWACSTWCKTPNIRSSAAKQQASVTLPAGTAGRACALIEGNACKGHTCKIVAPHNGLHCEWQLHAFRKPALCHSLARFLRHMQNDNITCRKRGTGPFATATVTTLSGPSCNPKAVPGKAQQVKATPSSSRNDRVTVTWAPNSGGGNGCVNGYRVEGFDASNGERSNVLESAASWLHTHRCCLSCCMAMLPQLPQRTQLRCSTLICYNIAMCLRLQVPRWSASTWAGMWRSST